MITPEKPQMTQITPSVIDDIIAIPSWEEKYQTIIDLGKNLPKMPEADKNEKTFVPGCMSQIWIKTTKDGAGKYHFTGDSDAFIVKGFLAVFFAVLDGKSAGQIKAFNFTDIFSKMGLHENLSPNRRNGLFVMEKYIKDHAPD